MVNDYSTVFSYQAFIAKYLPVTDLTLHGLLIIQKQPPKVLCKKVVLKNLANFTRKRLRRNILIRDSNTGLFL